MKKKTKTILTFSTFMYGFGCYVFHIRFLLPFALHLFLTLNKQIIQGQCLFCHEIIWDFIFTIKKKIFFVLKGKTSKKKGKVWSFCLFVFHVKTRKMSPNEPYSSLLDLNDIMTSQFKRRKRKKEKLSLFREWFQMSPKRKTFKQARKKSFTNVTPNTKSKQKQNFMGIWNSS